MDEIVKPQEPQFGISQDGTKKVGFLIDQQQKEIEMLQNFFFLIWSANPTRDTVRVIINEGKIKMWLRRDKFVKIMKDLLGPKTHELAYTLFRIESSMATYGVWYYLDREKNFFQEIGFVPDVEHINPMDLIKETRQFLVKEKLNDHWKDLTKESDTLNNTILDKQMPTSNFSKFFSVVRNWTKRRDKPL